MSEMNFSKIFIETIDFKIVHNKVLIEFGRSLQEKGIWIGARFLASNYSQMISCLFVGLLGVSVTFYLNQHWITPADLGSRVTQDLQMVLTVLADRGLVEKAVNLAIERVLFILVKVLEILEGSSILKLDCQKVGSYLVQTCESGVTDGLTDIACDLFTGSAEDVCVPLDFLSRPLSASVTSAERSLSISSVFNATVLREPFVKVISDSMGDNLNVMINRWYPNERYMVVAPAIVFTVVAFIASVTIATIVIPSFISTILKLRSGVIETFTNKSFPKYRDDIMDTSWTTGAMFWGSLIGSIVVGLAFGGVLFFSLWQVTSFLAQRFVGLLIGVGFIAAIRELYWYKLQRRLYSGFYRVNPLSANWVAVIDQSVNFALTIVTVDDLSKL